jgi:23S rRNA (guanosine2251-2'-O)-methyltransferase
MNRAVTYGIHPVRVLLSRNPQRVRRLLLAAGREDRRLAELRALAERARVPVVVAGGDELAALTDDGRHQGVVAETEPLSGDPETRLEEALEAAAGPPLLLALDGVQDPHNLGACLRSADAAGVAAVIAPRDRSAGLTPVARKVAAGAAESVPFIAVVNLARTLRQLKDRDFRVIGADDSASRRLFDADLGGPLVVVLGSEGEGLRRLTRECCNELVSIPMAGAVESLNVSVATGVMLFEAVRQRRQAGSEPP